MQEDVTDMELKDTLDNGESVVQIAGIGKVVGSDVDGNPVEQELDEESLKKLADSLNASGKEILVDRDHASSRPGLDRDTSAQGWASEFEVREGKGLFGKVKWSDVGRKLVENRVFRWLSPVFRIGKDRKPVDMQAIALTNTPSQPLLKPVLNQAADGEQIENNEKAEGLEMNVEDIRKIVFEVLKEAGLAVDGKAVADEIKKEIAEEKLDRLEDEAEKKAVEAIVESAAKEEVKNEACNKVETEAANEVKNEAACETKDEVKNEVCDEVKKDEVKDEVIKAEVLNQKPTIGIAAGACADKWRGMKGKDFIKYIESGAYRNDL